MLGAGTAYWVVRKRFGVPHCVLIYGGTLVLYAVFCILAGLTGPLGMFSAFRLFGSLVLFPVAGGLVSLWRESQETQDHPF